MLQPPESAVGSVDQDREILRVGSMAMPVVQTVHECVPVMAEVTGEGQLVRENGEQRRRLSQLLAVQRYHASTLHPQLAHFGAHPWVVSACDDDPW
jgi:hypothetical protein